MTIVQFVWLSNTLNCCNQAITPTENRPSAGSRAILPQNRVNECNGDFTPTITWFSSIG
jgi:hypothetical protein